MYHSIDSGTYSASLLSVRLQLAEEVGPGERGAEADDGDAADDGLRGDERGGVVGDGVHRRGARGREHEAEREDGARRAAIR